MGGFEKVLTALGILLVLILVLYLSYICTRYVGKRARGRAAHQSAGAEQMQSGRVSRAAAGERTPLFSRRDAAERFASGGDR